MQAYYWLILFAILLAVEIFTLGLTTIWFAGGALVAFFAALAGANLYVQLILWLVVSVLLLVCTRPVAKKYICKKQEKTNVDSLVGQETVVCEDISNRENTGKVMINGIEWTARAEDPTAMYEKGSIVRILRIEGVKVIVEKGEYNYERYDRIYLINRAGSHYSVGRSLLCKGSAPGKSFCCGASRSLSGNLVHRTSLQGADH